MTRKDLDNSQIKELYLEKGLSISRIAQQFGACPATILKRLVISGVTRRPASGGRFKFRTWRLNLDSNKIKTLYEEDKLSIPRIAKQFGVSALSIRRRLIASGAHIRLAGESHHFICQKGLAKKHPMHLKLNTELIERRYLENIPIPEIAQELGCSNKAIEIRLKLRGIYEKGRWKRLRKEHPEYNWAWRGGKSIKSGYVYIKCPSHHRAGKDGYAPEHIIVWEKYSGMELPKGWVVHHLNGIRDDNRFENLYAMPRKKHDTLIPAYKQRICSLEEELEQLKKTLKGE